MSVRGMRLAAALLLLQGARADLVEWTNPSGGSWKAPVNWQGGLIPSAPGGNAGFTTIDVTRDMIVTLDDSITLGGLSFADSSPSHDWYLRSGKGGGLTLDAASGAPLIHVANRSATIGVGLSGDKGFIKTGSGVLHLTGIGAYTGPTVVSGGTLRLGAPPQFPAGMRILPLGDSITYGFNGENAGYRGPLCGLLTPLAPDFQYIGTSTLRPGSLPAGQQRHEGHSSFALQDVNHNLDGFDDSKFRQYGGADRNPNGGYWLTGGNGTGRGPMHPDVITMLLGTNDLDIMTDVETRLRDLISKIVTFRPEARLIVAMITPIPTHASVDSYNRIVDRAVKDFKAAGCRVSLVDLNTNFPADGLDPDGVHPNSTGFDWMALQWHDAIIQACSPAGGTTLAIPASSPVNIGRAAVLDLDGTQAATGDVSLAGTLEFRSGSLTTPYLRIHANGRLAGSGTVHGSVIHSGAGIGIPGQSLVFTGTVTNNGTLNPPPGAVLSFGGNFINNGSLTCDGNQSMVFGGNLVNNGILRLSGAPLDGYSGTFVNNGILDLPSGMQDLPDGLVNNGVVVDSSEVRIHSASFTDSGVTLTVLARSGIDYQLQHSDSLENGTWENVGESQSGDAGIILVFTAVRDPAATRAFYRLRVSR